MGNKNCSAGVGRHVIIFNLNHSSRGPIDFMVEGLGFSNKWLGFEFEAEGLRFRFRVYISVRER